MLVESSENQIKEMERHTKELVKALSDANSCLEQEKSKTENRERQVIEVNEKLRAQLSEMEQQREKD